MSKGGSDEQESTQQVIPWCGAQPHLSTMFNTAGQLVNQGSPAYYPGQTFAGRDPLSDQAQNLSLNYATSSMPGQIYDAQRAQSFALNSPDVANNPYVQNMMAANQFNVQQNLSENILPRLGSGAVAAGQYGGSRQGIAEGLAARDSQQALATANAQTMMDAYTKGLGAQQGALAMAPQTMGMGLMPMDIMGQVGQYNTGIDEQALGADMERWNYNQNLPWENLNRYSSIVSQAPWGSTSTAEGGGSSPIAGALGGAMLGHSATPALSSMLGTSLGPWGAIGGAVLGGLLS